MKIRVPGKTCCWISGNKVAADLSSTGIRTQLLLPRSIVPLTISPAMIFAVHKSALNDLNSYVGAAQLNRMVN